MTEPSPTPRTILHEIYRAAVKRAAVAQVVHRSATATAASRADELGLTAAEQEADYQAELARAEPRS
ncbi:hypothetical protein D9V32_05480 [Mycetocola tolaasinivorans]|uniref:Uncharacterized protein n=1 Tax=Mycetocola tolaasinivorans TaxID=76635 RepID=A0A3L7A9Q5_9MICO|nr:hypothetical protein [Mycetocola tolaasinivorans]RLP76321.1 hypothetical protein D9V32_05480 [Mycetocola tolaasinivorans]